MDKKAFVLMTAIIAVFLDQLTKLLVIKNANIGESIPVTGRFFHLTYVQNTGSAFGIFKGMNLFFIILSFAVAAAILYHIKKINEKEKALQLAAGLLLGGTLGNLIDRLVYGFVIDFIDFRVWPVFNIADSAITVSVVMLVIILWKK